MDGMPSDVNVSLASGVKEFCLRNSGKGILVLITDLMDKQGYETAIRYLVSQQMDVYVIHLLSEEEIHPDVAGDLKLVDCEDNDQAEITVSRPLLDRYERTLASFISAAQSFCAKRNVMYMMTSTETPVETLVGNYLRQRGLVR